MKIQELTIAAAASIAMWALDEGYTVGLLANSLMMGLAGEHASSGNEQTSRPQSVNTNTVSQTFMHRVRIPMASDSGQREQILSALGRLLPYFGSQMDALIESERFTLPIGTTVVLVSAASVLRETTIENLVDLRTHGAVVHLALTGDADSNVGADTYDLPVHRIGGRGVWHELVTAVNNEKYENIGRSAKSLYLD